MQGETTAQTGDSYDVGNFVYEITNADKKTVTLTDKIKDKKSVTVPATVKINGVTYKVTGIGAGVWEDDGKVKTIVIGKNVQKIGANAFAGAKQLKKITIKSTALKSVGNKAFKNISAKAVIKVPGKKKAEYKKLLKGKGQKKTVVIK